jgi:hypothetical protein
MMRDLNAEASAEAEAALRDFTQSSIALARLLQRGARLTDLERLSIENNLAIVQLNYAVWMRKSDDR